ncbi:MAG TPA: CehA/McbA family metallohydrolase, partial [Gemmatimonadales bacterium]
QRLVLERLANLLARGWWSGDLHVHMNYGGAYRNTPSHLAFQARAEDLHVVENLIVNKEQRIPDIAYFRTDPDPVSTPGFLLLHDQEYHTSYWGHTGLLGLSDHYVLPEYVGYPITAAASLYPMNADVADLAHAQGALFGYVHPFDTKPDPTDTTERLTYELPVDAALGKIDYMEVMGYSDHLITSGMWYRLLNCGFRIPAGAGTDAFPNFASLRGPPGLVRVFVRSGPALDRRSFLAGLKAGRTFVTNAPLLEFTLRGREIGDEIRLPTAGRLTARVNLRSSVPIDHLEVIGNGSVVATIPLKGDRMSATEPVSIPIAKSGWYVLRAWSDRPALPVLDLYPFGSTSPIYVRVGRASALAGRCRLFRALDRPAGPDGAGPRGLEHGGGAGARIGAARTGACGVRGAGRYPLGSDEFDVTLHGDGRTAPCGHGDLDAIRSGRHAGEVYRERPACDGRIVGAGHQDLRPLQADLPAWRREADGLERVTQPSSAASRDREQCRHLLATRAQPLHLPEQPQRLVRADARRGQGVWQDGG